MDDFMIDADIELLIKHLKTIEGNDARTEYLANQDTGILSRLVIVLLKQIGLMTLCSGLDDLKDELMK